MTEQKKKTKEQRRSRRKVMEPKPLTKELLEAQVRIAALEKLLIPVARESLRYAVMTKGRPEQKVAIPLRSGFLKELRLVLAGQKKPNHEEYPDFTVIARHLIEDLGNDLLNIGALAHELALAFDAGYEQRRCEDLAIANGEKVKRDE